MRRSPYCRSASWLAALVLLTSSPSTAEPPRSIQTMTVEVVRLHSTGQLDSAIALATSISKRVENEYGPRDVRLAQALNNLAILYDDARRPIESEKLYLRAISIVEAQPQRIVFQLVELKNNLGAVLLQQCRLDDARTHFEQALVMSVEALGSYHPNSEMVRENLRRVSIAEGRLAQSPADPAGQTTAGATTLSGQSATQSAFMGLLRGCMS